MSYLPLCLAFHCTTFATLCITLSPGTSLSFLPPTSPRSRRSLTTGRQASIIAVWTAVFFLLSSIPAIVATAFARERQLHAAREVLEGIDGVERSGQGLAGLVGLVPLYERLVGTGMHLFNCYRAVVGLYGLWAIVWMLVSRTVSLRGGRKLTFVFVRSTSQRPFNSPQPFALAENVSCEAFRVCESSTNSSRTRITT
jgi:hypothetical protein